MRALFDSDFVSRDDFIQAENVVKWLLNDGKILTADVDGRNARLFVSNNDNLCYFEKGCRKRGYLLPRYALATVCVKDASPPKTRVSLSAKYRSLASKARFTNQFIRDCLAADPAKSPYENGLTTGNQIDGKVIRFNTVMRYMGENDRDAFLRAWADPNSEWRSNRFKMYGYVCCVSVFVCDEESGERMCSLSVEFAGKRNGYYYLLINDDAFVGYDVD